jgi:hypothetical protein
MNPDPPLYVLVAHHSSLKGVLPLRGICERLGGLLRISTVLNDTYTHVFFFDQSIYGRAFIQAVERTETGVVVAALNSTVRL